MMRVPSALAASGQGQAGRRASPGRCGEPRHGAAILRQWSTVQLNTGIWRNSEDLRYHRIIAWLGLQGTLKMIQFQPPCSGQGCHQLNYTLDQTAQGPH